MTTEHLSEAVIQQYALDEADKEAAFHIEQCEACKAKVRTYQFLFTEVKTLPAPVFDFDVAGMVLAQLPASKKAFRLQPFLTGIWVMVATALLLLLLFLLNTNLWKILTGLSPWLTGSMAIIIIPVILSGTIDLYNRYQEKMQQLNVE